MTRTLSKFERRRVYSSRTSCSRGVQAGSWFDGGGAGSAIAAERGVYTIAGCGFGEASCFRLTVYAALRDIQVVERVFGGKAQSREMLGTISTKFRVGCLLP